MLQFVEGTSGSGKTDTIRHMLMEKAKTGEEKLLLLVPEQNSFENERAMLRLMGPKEAGRITVTSFTRMVDLVMRQTGGLAGRRRKKHFDEPGAEPGKRGAGSLSKAERLPRIGGADAVGAEGI